MDYELLSDFFQKYFVVHEQSAVKNSFSTYVGILYPGWFILIESVYRRLLKLKLIINGLNWFAYLCIFLWKTERWKIVLDLELWKAMKYFFHNFNHFCSAYNYHGHFYFVQCHSIRRSSIFIKFLPVVLFFITHTGQFFQ